MSDQNQGGGKRKQNITAPEAKVDFGNQESPHVQPETAAARQESKADTLLRNIFFRSGPLPMAPDQAPGK